MSDEPMFTERELVLLDSVVNPAKWSVRDEMWRKAGYAYLGGGDRQYVRETVAIDRRRFDELDALSRKIKELQRDARRSRNGLPSKP